MTYFPNQERGLAKGDDNKASKKRKSEKPFSCNAPHTRTHTDRMNLRGMEVVLVMLVLLVLQLAFPCDGKERLGKRERECPAGTSEHFSNSLAHPDFNLLEGQAGSTRPGSHRPQRHRHCVCLPGYVCTGSLCSSAHENCTTSSSSHKGSSSEEQLDCSLVHGFLAACPDCSCVPSSTVEFKVPDQLFLSLVDNGRALAFNFAVHGKASRPHVTVWEPPGAHSAQPQSQARAPSPPSGPPPLQVPATDVTLFTTTAATAAGLPGKGPHPEQQQQQQQQGQEGVDIEQSASHQFLPNKGALEVVAEQRASTSEKPLDITFWIATLENAEGKQLCYRAWNGDAHTATACVHVPTRGFPHQLLLQQQQQEQELGSSSGSKEEGEDEVLSTIAVVGDLGMSYSAPMVMQAMKDDPSIDMLVHPGDVSYAFQVDEMNLYLARLQGLINHVPYMVCLGNHEANNDKVLRAFTERFPTDVLGRNSGSDSAHWFSFDAYGIHFTVLDSQDDFAPGSAQHQWLQADLQRAAENRARHVGRALQGGEEGEGKEELQVGADGVNGLEGVGAGESGPDIRWLVVVLHYPLYSTHRRKSDNERRDKLEQMQQLRKGLEPTFCKHGVDIVIAGHDHVYERSVPVFNASVAEEVVGAARAGPHCPAHITAGTGGHNIYESWYNLPPYDGSCPSFASCALVCVFCVFCVYFVCILCGFCVCLCVLVCACVCVLVSVFVRACMACAESNDPVSFPPPPALMGCALLLLWCSVSSLRAWVWKAVGERQRHVDVAVSGGGHLPLRPC